MATLRRRDWIRLGTAAGAGLCWGSPMRALAKPKAPFKKLAAIDPPYLEEYEVVIAMAPPLARGTLGKAVNKIVTEADSVVKTEQLTRAIDPEKTNLHGHFVQALAEELDEADVKVVLVPVDPATTEQALLDQARSRVADADAILLANVMGRFVALHGLAAYMPGVMLGVKLLAARGSDVWVDMVYTTGFRGLDLRATHVELDMEERYLSFDSLMRDMSQARAALIRGVEQIAVAVAQTVVR